MAATDRVQEARREQAAFRNAVLQVPETSFLFQNSSRSILDVADAMLEGEILYREEKFADAFLQLREAIRLDDSLNYDEPWGWMQPTRHALGALLLEQHQFSEAESVYRADLQRHPKNMWALHGLAESLVQQDKIDEAELVAREFERVSARADITVDRSCFCRLQAD